MNEDPLIAEKISEPSRRDRLSAGHKKRSFDFGYSGFIRKMRILLPLAALCIIAVLFSWNLLKTDAIIVQTTDSSKNEAATRNELLNPRFDSVDDKNQPYTITADRAVQSEGSKNAMHLEKPMADIILKNGNWLAIQSNKGTYDQGAQTLKLEEDVMLYHDQGYSLKMAALDIDLRGYTAHHEGTIEGQGPAGLLSAQGVNADSKAQKIIFKGPAKLVIFTGADLNLEGMKP